MKKITRTIYLLNALSIIIIVLISTFFLKKLNAYTELSDKGEKTLKIITLIEKLNVILLNAENKQLEFLAKKDERIRGNKNPVIEESRLILNDIKSKINKSDLQYETFIKLKHSTNLRFRVMFKEMQYNTSFNELNINQFF